MTASEVSALISEHTPRIQLGMVLVSLGAAFLAPFICEITVQMRRIEGPHSPLSWPHLGPGTLFSQRTGNPARSAAIDQSWCIEFGRATYTASISGSPRSSS
jgi:hypothetical protein